MIFLFNLFNAKKIRLEIELTLIWVGFLGVHFEVSVCGEGLKLPPV